MLLLGYIVIALFHISSQSRKKAGEWSITVIFIMTILLTATMVVLIQFLIIRSRKNVIFQYKVISFTCMYASPMLSLNHFCFKYVLGITWQNWCPDTNSVILLHYFIWGPSIDLYWSFHGNGLLIGHNLVLSQARLYVKKSCSKME